jgi:hypothetical protein
MLRAQVGDVARGHLHATNAGRRPAHVGAVTVRATVA